ncbi:MAG: ribulose 1,5-bisphosphate carboxylase [Ectothiorhodospiraceae bacterium]|nr:ribulose 1,5-bisphosphate carboxylase [Ectothiorhodospiraceae bacterium]MCH8503905.1 ribulose 1,5-bisphosphate carboxylase [Ectothiorhodospiraceae bacterium]
MGNQFTVHYRLHCAPGEDPMQKARGIALEQTVELPADCLRPDIADTWVGQIQSLEEQAPRQWNCAIAYDSRLAGEELSQLLNTLFGNISLKSGIVVDAVDWPHSLLECFGGPRHGIEGLRQMTGVPAGKPMTCTALKPVGYSAEELAALAYAFALGGVDIIKDDHGIANQPTAPYLERLHACQQAVERANRETGGSSRYFPNVTAPHHLLKRRLDAAADAGCEGALISPWLTGLDSLRWARDHSGLAMMAHPALTGGQMGETHGLSPALLLGELFRLAGADASIYPNTGGRFGFTEDQCHAINRALREPLGGLKPSAPTPGGGMDAERAPYWIERYGPDTIILIGGSLYAQGDITAASGNLLKALGR